MSTNKISSSKREIYNKLLDIASKYVKIDETNFLTSGLFGYITEMQAMALRDSAIHKEMVYNEHFLNKAMIPESVYNYAKMFNVEIKTATPAYSDIEIVIPTSQLQYFMKTARDNDDLVRYGSDVPNGDYCIIDKENVIVAGDYMFSLEHSILIVQETKDSSIKYSAQYITSEYESTKFQSNYNKYLTTTTEVSDGQINICIKARIYQYDQTVTNRVITTSTFVNKIQRFEFTDQFCGAALFYIENGQRKEIELLNTDYSAIKDSAYYNFSSENELEVVFKLSNAYFQPSQNSELEMHIYTTKGEDVPSMYKDNGVFQFTDSAMRSFPAIVRFVAPYSIIGGHDRPTLERLKESIIASISTRNTITTNSDLQNYFKILTSLIDDINNGQVTFKKIQDDVLKRIYNSYLLLRDNTDDVNYSVKKTGGYISSCVPTNNVTIKISNDITSIPSGTKFTKSTESINNIPYYNISKNTNITDYYTSPFSINIKTINNVPIAEYQYDATDDSCELLYNSDACEKYNTHSIVPQTIRIKRGFNNTFNIEDSFTIEASFITDFNINDVSRSGSITFSIDKEYTISNPTITSVANNDSETSFLTTITGTIKVGDEIDIDSINETNNILIKLNDLQLDNENVPLVFISSRKLQFKTNMSRLMSMDVIAINNNTVITDIPVVHSSFFNDESVGTETRREGFVKQLFTYINILKQNLDRLENSTFFNLKFYNTYGPAYIYDTSSTNIKLELYIVLNSKVNEYTREQKNSLKSEIRSYARRIFDNMNADNQISISSIISTINNESTYAKYIGRIEFRGLNDTFSQFIKKVSGMEDSDIVLTPEWLNLDATTLTDSIVIKTEDEIR